MTIFQINLTSHYQNITMQILNNMLPTAIAIRFVVDTCIVPTINTGIAHKNAGVGQVGAGVVKAPLACFQKAIKALAEVLNVI